MSDTTMPVNEWEAAGLDENECAACGGLVTVGDMDEFNPGDICHDCEHAELERLKSARKGHALVSLEQLRWVESRGGMCPACHNSTQYDTKGNRDPRHHSPDCWLAAAIKEAEAE